MHLLTTHEGIKDAQILPIVVFKYGVLSNCVCAFAYIDT